MTTTFAEVETRLAASLPGYEPRPQQQQLAAAVERALARVGSEEEPPRHLLGQAGCGVGKAFAYAIPVALSGRRAVVSVTTKSLQDQLADKDLPFVVEHVFPTLDWCVLKGRSNYLCGAKLLEVDESEVPALPGLREAAEREGFDGTREGLGFLVSDREWAQVCAETEDCSDYGCKRALRDGGPTCFAEVARARAREARLVVVNHALFVTDLAIKVMAGGGEDAAGAGMLPDYELVVFDEAHELEEVAADNLGVQLVEAAFRGLSAELRNWLARYHRGDGREELEAAAARMLEAAVALFEVLPAAKGRPTRVREATIVEHEREFMGVFEAVADLHGMWHGISLERVATEDYPVAKKRHVRIGRRMGNLVGRLQTLIGSADLVRWVEVETTRRGEDRKVLRSAPVDVSAYLGEHLFEVTPAVLVSATLATGGRFDFVAGRLGIARYESVDVGSPFDFRRQARLYVPRIAVPRGKDVDRWQAEFCDEVVGLVDAAGGGALLLFTSRANMRATYEAVRHRLSDYTLLVQGDAPVGQLGARFISEEDSVLFGTRSFMTGFDPRGRTCRLVIVDKMPFPVPTDPKVEARCDLIRARRGDDFREYSMPVMSLILQQAAGRLVRHTSDMGVIAVGDSRLADAGYGRQIQRDLPPAPLVRSMAEVRGFYESLAAVV